MRTLVATALLAYAKADETSLMQDLLKRSASNRLSAKTNRQDSTSKLLDTAVNMIKNGVTPDVVEFVDATNLNIEDALGAIQHAHTNQQNYIDELCAGFAAAIAALEDQAAEIAVHDSNRVRASEEHHACRAEEAYTCAKSRRCEEQLRQKWVTVKHEETVMREIHGHIHDEWCIHPPFFAEIDDWLSHPFNWAQTSPYPILDLPQDVRDFRHVSVTHFHDYMEQKIIVERAWQEYNEKLVECAELEDEWEVKLPECDEKQRTKHEHACAHAVANREARRTFGREYDRILNQEWRLNEEQIKSDEQDRKNEYETLHIVKCLLDHVHSSVITSLETGAPCPTIDSDPEGVTLAIEDCHIVERGCEFDFTQPDGTFLPANPDSWTAHLCLNWCEIPPPPPLPPVEEPACTPAYIAREQAQFLEAIQVSYTAELAANSDYPNDALTQYETVLSAAGWAGCAPPLVCVDCTGTEPEPPCLEHVTGAHTCHTHEEYLAPGQSNADTFRCFDGSCIHQAGRCNGHSNCADSSDEEGCDNDDLFVPAYVTKSFTCPDDFHDDVHFRCANSECIDKLGLCNGEPNCADGSDEAQCTGLAVSVEALSGRTITVETASSSTGVFHDREYSFDSLGHFAGKTFIKYSNDDKMIDYDHVMLKLRVLEPTTVFIVSLANHPSWLATQGYTPSAVQGVTFSGVRETRHKEWDTSLLTTDHFDASTVYSKTFPAGTISIPGNNGGDGSFLVFIEKAGAEPEIEYDARLTAYWESGNCGHHGNDWNWAWCGQTAGNCPVEVQTEYCASGEAELVAFHGTGAANSYQLDGCNYFYHAQYRCLPVPETTMGEELFIGCFVDDGARDLGAMIGGTGNAATNTFALCRAACGDHTYMALQYGGECFCSNSYGNGAQYVQVDESECNRNVEPCSSNSYNCGGTWRQAIYQINDMQQLSSCSTPAFYGNDGHSSAGNPDGASAIQFIDIGSGPLVGSGTLDAVTFRTVRQNQAGLKFQIYRPVGGNVYNLVAETDAFDQNGVTSITQHNFAPLSYQDGDYLGWVHTGQGTFPYTTGAGNVRWKYGIEAVGSNIDFNGQGARTYAYRASLFQC